MTTSAKTTRHEFQAETQQLLNLMIHSLYTNRDIFLRELISNASDALDKRRFMGLTNTEIASDEELHIRIEVDSDANVLTISDNGIGMNLEELEKNLGTIAHSGTKHFRDVLSAERSDAKADAKADADKLIGQFGVGFYSGFMVADKLEVISKKAGSEDAHLWQSSGDGQYELGKSERSEAGTTITLHLKATDDGEETDTDYSQPWKIKQIIKQYSDFVAYPIKMKEERQEAVLDDDGKPVEGATPRVYSEDVTLNSMQAIWLRPKEEVEESDYKEFYKHISHDWNDPLVHFATRMEGAFEARALLFIPGKAPFDLYHREMGNRGIQLYLKRVFIMDECKELMPDYLRFVKGVVDADGLSLNVSREVLQQDKQVAVIRKHLVKKTLDALRDLKKNDLEKYLGFWAEFGPVMKEGLLGYEAHGKEKILDLMMVASSTQDGLTTLAEYTERMADDQDKIYYITAPNSDAAKNSPHLEAFSAANVEVLLLTDPIDEMWLQVNSAFKEKAFSSVLTGDVKLPEGKESKEDEESKKAQKETLAPLLKKFEEALQEEIKEVRLSERLTDSAVCLVTDDGGMTPQMEMLLKQSGQTPPKTKRILELNGTHNLVQRLSTMDEESKLKPYASLLYGQAVLAEGGQLEDPAAFAKLMASVLADGIPEVTA